MEVASDAAPAFDTQFYFRGAPSWHPLYNAQVLRVAVYDSGTMIGTCDVSSLHFASLRSTSCAWMLTDGSCVCGLLVRACCVALRCAPQIPLSTVAVRDPTTLRARAGLPSLAAEALAAGSLAARWNASVAHRVTILDPGAPCVREGAALVVARAGGRVL